MQTTDWDRYLKLPPTVLSTVECYADLKASYTRAVRAGAIQPDHRSGPDAAALTERTHR